MKKRALIAACLIATVSTYAHAWAMAEKENLNIQEVTPLEKYAQKVYLKLTGTPANLFDPRFRRVVDLLKRNDYMGAARVMTDAPNFLNVRVRNFSIPFIDKTKRPNDGLNDLQALIVGVVKDELDARLILTGDFRYSGYDRGLPKVSRENNDHFAAFEAQAMDFNRDLEKVDKQWEDMDYVAGAFTTRAWANAYYNGGTNRLAVKYGIENFLCIPIDEWKLRGLPDYFVRRDVDRADVDKPQEFQNTCRSCHNAMDAIGGAFAKLDFVDSQLTFVANGVAAKMNNNSHFYPAGFVTTDDSWINLLENHPTVKFGWRGPTSEGMGIASFAKVLANSEAFSGCMVKKVFAEVCGKNISQVAPDLWKPLTTDFESNSYNMKYLFGRVATEDACISHKDTEVQ